MNKSILIIILTFISVSAFADSIYLKCYTISPNNTKSEYHITIDKSNSLVHFTRGDSQYSNTEKAILAPDKIQFKHTVARTILMAYTINRSTLEFTEDVYSPSKVSSYGKCEKVENTNNQI